MRKSAMSPLIADNILLQEFNYIQETAAQTTVDRNKLLSFYVGLATSAGTASIAIFSLSPDGDDHTFARLAFALLTFLIAVVGWIFLAMMIRLRQAWYESLLALNQIKKFYIQNSTPDISKAFVWDATTLPRPEKFWNIHFYASGLINFISSLALTISLVAVMFDRVTPLGLSAMACIIWLISLIFLTFTYWISLVRNY
jgi:hypothetical protein